MLSARFDSERGGENLIYGILICLVSLYIIAAAYFNWDFFFDSRKARPFVNIFGRNGARIFYGALGILFFIFGIICMFNS